MEINITIYSAEGEELFSQTATSFVDADAVLGQAQRYIERQEAKALLTSDDDNDE